MTSIKIVIPPPVSKFVSSYIEVYDDKQELQNRIYFHELKNEERDIAEAVGKLQNVLINKLKERKAI